MESEIKMPKFEEPSPKDRNLVKDLEAKVITDTMRVITDNKNLLLMALEGDPKAKAMSIIDLMNMAGLAALTSSATFLHVLTSGETSEKGKILFDDEDLAQAIGFLMVTIIHKMAERDHGVPPNDFHKLKAIGDGVTNAVRPFIKLGRIVP